MTETPTVSRPEQPPARRNGRALGVWNRRIHNYVGLYFLLFVWLFSVSGLLLNRSDWTFADFWPQREEASRTEPIVVPAGGGDIAIANDLMRQLGIRGEINQISRDPAGTAFRFQAGRPGETFTVEADFAARQATVERIGVNGWGVLKTLHTFSGVSVDDPARRREWVLTKVWSFAIDALAVGLIVLVATGVYLWWVRSPQRTLGVVMLSLGSGLCVLFVFGLRLMFPI